ncbi:MAG: CopG family transcriptional regulator [Candidatus Acidiferrales bacterium]
MRTTINLPDGLLVQAKKLAADRGTTLTEIIADALRSALFARRPGRKRKARSLPTFTPPPGKEGVLPGVDLNNTAALLDLMDAYDAAHRR